ncbi:MAG TPA: hypothetical protein VLF67_02845 [Candidatus Saccharimonas sp.]|nr:hypothetical protein [Candidatus Saccharimonas sp.]
MTVVVYMVAVLVAHHQLLVSNGCIAGTQCRLDGAPALTDPQAWSWSWGLAVIYTVIPGVVIILAGTAAWVVIEGKILERRARRAQLRQPVTD